MRGEIPRAEISFFSCGHISLQIFLFLHILQSAIWHPFLVFEKSTIKKTRKKLAKAKKSVKARDKT